MDGGPFRTSRQAAKGTNSRTDSQHHQPKSEIEKESPQTGRDSSVGGAPDPVVPKKRTLSVILALVAAIALGWLAWTNLKSDDLGVDPDKYQAVVFSNGQVYFGKLKSLNSDSVRLTDVYYPQVQPEGESTDADTQQGSVGQSNVLVKLGDEVHGPEDEMMIPKSQILYYENLKPDGRVVTLINQHKQE